MRVVDIIPKDIVILTEFTVEQIRALRFCLDHSQVTYNTSDPAEQKQVEYFTGRFYNDLVEIEERLTNVS